MRKEEKTRRERYKETRRIRKKLGNERTRCKDCGCYIKGRHKVWCCSEEANKIRAEKK